MSCHLTPFFMPNPMAFENASFAANLMEKVEEGKALREHISISPGVKMRSMNLSPHRLLQSLFFLFLRGLSLCRKSYHQSYLLPPILTFPTRGEGIVF